VLAIVGYVLLTIFEIVIHDHFRYQNIQVRITFGAGAAASAYG
jgi:hypothetical protein